MSCLHWFALLGEVDNVFSAGKLEKYWSILLQGVSFFKAPNEESKKTVQEESKLSIEDKKLPIDLALKQPALEVSRLLVRFSTNFPSEPCCADTQRNQFED